MGLLFWKDNKKIDAFANAVAEDLYSHIQPKIADQHFRGIAQQNKKKQRKIEQRLAGIIGQMQQFSAANSLSIYGKARLQKKFSDRLLELGYDVAATNKLVETILLQNR
jgi:hypothetical protein